MSYFWTPRPISLKADVARHREEQARLEAKIAELEMIAHPTDMEARALRAYRSFLTQLLQSKAEVTSKIGRRQS